MRLNAKQKTDKALAAFEAAKKAAVKAHIAFEAATDEVTLILCRFVPNTWLLFPGSRMMEKS